MKTLANACKAADQQIEENSWLPYTEKRFRIGICRKTSQGETFFWVEKVAKGSEVEPGGWKTPLGISEEDALKVGTKVYRLTTLVERIK